MAKKWAAEEAEKIYDKFLKLADTGNVSFDDLPVIAKRSSIEAIDMMLYQSHVFCMRTPGVKDSFITYWKEIKDEIIKM